MTPSLTLQVCIGSALVFMQKVQPSKFLPLNSSISVLDWAGVVLQPATNNRAREPRQRRVMTFIGEGLRRRLGKSSGCSFDASGVFNQRINKTSLNAKTPTGQGAKVRHEWH